MTGRGGSWQYRRHQEPSGSVIMQLLITFKAFDKVRSKLDAELMQHSFEQLLYAAVASNGLVASGFYADAPGGFLIVEVDSTERIAALLNLDQANNFYITVKHLLPFERLVEHLELWSEAEQSYGLYSKGVL